MDVLSKNDKYPYQQNPRKKPTMTNYSISKFSYLSAMKLLYIKETFNGRNIMEGDNL